MTKKTKIDFIISMILIICGGTIMLLPIFDFDNVKIAFIIVMGIYLISNLINYLLVRKSKDGEGLYTSVVRILGIILLFLLDINSKPVNLAIVLLVWTLGMSLVKLKKADYYHDRENSLWVIHIIGLFIFILCVGYDFQFPDCGSDNQHVGSSGSAYYLQDSFCFVDGTVL